VGIKKEGCSQFYLLQKDSENFKKAARQKKYVTPVEVRQYIKALWRREKRILRVIFGTLETNGRIIDAALASKPSNMEKGFVTRCNSSDMFFLDVLVVPPNRFRPENKMGDQTYLHGQTVILQKILEKNQEMNELILM